jgi:hypothetical protein
VPHDGFARRPEHCNDSRESRAAHVSVVLRHRFGIPTYKTQKGCTRKDAGPTRGFTTYPGVGLGATVGTLKIRYPRIQASSQRRKARRAHMPACPTAPISWHRAAPESLVPHGDSSGISTCPMAPAPIFRHRTAPGLPRAPWPRLPSPSTGQLCGCHVPRGRSCRLRAIKVNIYLMVAQPSWSLSRWARVSSKALRDKDGARKMCKQAGCKPTLAQPCSTLTMVCYSRKWFNNSRQTASSDR